VAGNSGTRGFARATRLAGLTLRGAALVMACALPVGASVRPEDPSAASLPFRVGEELSFRMRSARFGKVGQGTMRIEGPETIRGVSTYRLCFDFEGKVAFAKIRDHTRSWVDPTRMASYRYSKRESSPLSSRTENVELYPDESRWTSGKDARPGKSPTDDPLDELSFLYYIRTLPLLDGDEYSVGRHFDPARNPVVIRVLRREVLTVPAGRFSTVVVEMKVQDPERFGGNGTLRMHLTDDVRRMPVRIQTSMPIAGAMILDLERWTEGGAPLADASGR
jgi:hypothetical protein